MTEVAFHLNVADVDLYVCRLLRKAYLKGARVAVSAEPALVRELDQRLWLMAQGEFVPHAGPGASARVLRHSPIALGADASSATDASVLVNLTGHLPEDPQRFDRVIEVVGTSENAVAQARVRWKAYRTSGLQPVLIDLASGPQR